MAENVEHSLRERVKELTALHGTARLLQEAGRPVDEVMRRVLALLPPAWQYPEITFARVTLGTSGWQTDGYAPSPWSQREDFRLRDGTAGCLEVVYAQPRPPADEGPFLREERDLIRSLSEMLRAYWQHRQDDEAIIRTNERLEQQVTRRTAALRRMASELCLAEARERRAIAEDLHDHLGQSLAFIHARLRQLRGDGVFGGHQSTLGQLLDLTEQAIRYTRSLTGEVSPPVLYELGLGPALEALAERLEREHGLKIAVRDDCRRQLPEDLRVLFFKSARELLLNVVKHASASRATVDLSCRRAEIVLTVGDDGRGIPSPIPATDRSFGLFSVEERLRHLGGRLEIDSSPGQGARVRLTAPLPAEAPQ